MAKVKVRTKAGGFRDDRFHLTTKWQDVDEADISPLWVDNPNIEIKTADGKFIPTPEPVPGVTLPRVAVAEVAEPEPIIEETKPEKDT